MLSPLLDLGEHHGDKFLQGFGDDLPFGFAGTKQDDLTATPTG
jgi:hypothetical protein